MAKGKLQKSSNGSALDVEAQFWAAADKMRGRMVAWEYNQVFLRLIFFQSISGNDLTAMQAATEGVIRKSLVKVDLANAITSN